MGPPPTRCWRPAAQASTASGVFSNSPASDRREPADWSRQKFFRSAQSMAANAANSNSEGIVVHASDMFSILLLERAGLGSSRKPYRKSRSRRLLTAATVNGCISVLHAPSFCARLFTSLPAVIQWSEWAKAYYRHLREEGKKSHQAAVRSLAFK